MARAPVRCALLIGCALGAAAADAPPPSSLRATVASRVARSCGTAVVPSGIETLIASRLRDAGVTISNVYNAQFFVDVECLPASTPTGGAALGVHQCLDFSELVAAPSRDGRPALASTWRKCGTNTCARSKCDASVRAAAELQLAELSANLQERMSAREQPRIAHASPTPPGGTGRVVFYSLYIMTCLSLIVYWQVRRQAY